MKKTTVFILTLLATLFFANPIQVSNAATISGLDFPGNGGGTIRFKFTNPHLNGLPIYGPNGNGVTYIWRAYPRQQSGYYTTFFWANDDGKGTLHDTFYWPGNDAPDTYYGAHPYPPTDDRTYHEWEIACYNGDFRNNSAVTYNRWHTQVFMAWKDGNGFKVHKYYWDWPDQNKVIYYSTESPDDPNYGETNPPYPALTWGDAPWNPGYEVYDGIIRGIQIYNSLLSLSDIASELSSPLSSTVGAASIWYININPTPTDISDKSGKGHNPTWVGSGRPALYTEGTVSDTQAPTTPTNLSAQAVSSNQINLSWVASTDNVGVTGYMVERCQGASCTNFAQIATPAATTFSDTGLTANTAYRYQVRATDAAGNLSGYSGIASATTQQVTSQLFGLEWPGDGSVRRMLYWHNPFPIYDATYIFKVYPRKKTDAIHGYYKYYTTFFWGNDGEFSWWLYDGVNKAANTYYGAHPYPVPPPTGPGQWEISVNGGDAVTGSEVQWNRWYTQAFRAWRESSSVTHHEFYYDLPDTSKVIAVTVTDPRWASQNPPTPAIVIGQAPDACGPPPGNCGASWGGYPAWEEFNGIIRGIQIYSNDLSLADIQSEIAVPKSTVAGQNSIWYLNLNPRPSDVTDKKATGTPHNPLWDGSKALEWSDQADTTPPSTPTNLSATAVSSNQINLSWTASADNIGVTGYKIYRGGTQIANSITNSYQDAGLFSSTTYTYTVSAFDAAGNESTQSIAVSATTPTGPAPTLGLLAAYSFNEGTGTQALDYSGNSKNGTISGAIWSTQGKYSNAISFDGLNDKVTLPSALDISLPFTLEAWVYPTSYSDWRAIFSKRTGPSNACLDLGLSNGTGNVYIYTGSITNFSYVPPLNTWTHLATVLTSSSSQLYVNGNLNQTLGAVSLGTASSASVAIGNTPDDDDPFAGRIDELRLYNRALTQPEIQADMNTPIGVTTEGDVNQDSSVDILDVQALVNHILGTQDYGSSADANDDGSVDVLDVQLVVNVILGG